MNLIPSMLLLNKHKTLCLWPSCNNHPKTLSFRATTDQDLEFIHPVEPEVEIVTVTTLGSLFSRSSDESASVSTAEQLSDCSTVESIVRGVRSERLFFEPDPTSSILESQDQLSGRQCMLREIDGDDDGGGGGEKPPGNTQNDVFCKESVAMVVESDNPYVDFKKSMEEMVEILDMKDWSFLEELLGWYLRMNEKNNYEFIVGAFVDLLVGINGGGCRRGGGDGGDGDGDGDCGVSVLDHSIASLSSDDSTFSSHDVCSSPNGNSV